MKWVTRLATLSTGLLASACSGGLISNELPPSSELGSPGGVWRVARSIIHLHTPWSYDACDEAGLKGDGTLDEECLSHLRRALCLNHIDFAFVTDHPSHMRERSFTELLLARENDEIILDGGLPIANHLQDCGDGHRPFLLPGFEGQLLGVGMKQHLSDSSHYDSGTADTANDIQTTSQGIAIVPHTEKWSVTDIAALGSSLKGIEVYNMHAQLDPKIRNEFFHLEPFLPSMDLLAYWLDSFRVEQPDLAFLAAGQRPEIYDQKWNQLLISGTHVFGIAATDSHENIFPSKARDGERVDSHRRILRWFSNHLLVSSLSITDAKAALQAGRFWMVFEALGTPTGLDISATVSGNPVYVGENATFVSGQTQISVTLPSLHQDSPQGKEPPTIRIVIERIQADATHQIVAQTTDSSLEYSPDQAGYYRVKIFIVPLHLANFLNYDSDRAEEEHLWVLANPFRFL